MSIVEDLLRAKDTKADKSSPSPAPDAGPTLTEILNHGRNSALFGDFLQRGGMPDEELAARLKNGALTKDDLQTLEERRSAFQSEMNNADRVVKHLDVGMVGMIARRSPELAKMIALVGEEKMASMWQSQMYGLAINKPTEFNAINAAFEEYIKDRKSGDGRIKDACKSYGIQEGALENIQDIEGNWERWSAIRDEIKSSYGIFSSLLNKTTLGGLARYQAIRFDFRQKKLVTEALKDVETRMNALGVVLKGTIDTNDLVRKAFTHEIISEKKPVPGDLAFSEGRSIMPNDEAIVSEWKKKRPKNFDALSDADKDIKRDDFMRQYEKNSAHELGRRKGFWSLILGGVATLFLGTFDKKNLT